MIQRKRILVIGLDPACLALPDPHYGGAQWDGPAIRAAIEGGVRHLQSAGYEAESCLTDLGTTAVKVVTWIERRNYE